MIVDGQALVRQWFDQGDFGGEGGIEEVPIGQAFTFHDGSYDVGVGGKIEQGSKIWYIWRGCKIILGASFMQHGMLEAVVQQHPEAHRYRVAIKRNRIEVYERVGPDYGTVLGDMHMVGLSRPDLAERLQDLEEQHARYSPELRFNLLDPTRRLFGAERMCYRSSVDGWLELGQMGPVAQLARALIPTLGTDQFFELW